MTPFALREPQVPAFDAAAASVDLTPQWPVPLAGYYGRPGPFESVETPIEANAVWLGCGDRSVLFVSIDVLYAGPALTAAVRDCAVRHGLQEDAVVVTASHTHFAPATDAALPTLGAVDERWLGYCAGRITAMLETLLRSPRRHVRLETQETRIPLNVNRRLRWNWPTWTRDGLRRGPQIVMAPAPTELRDETAWLLRVVDDDGQILAWLWKYACHPTSTPRQLGLDAEYPGAVRDRLREVSGTPVPVVFWQGFAGDVRAWLVGGRSWRQRLGALRRGPEFGSVTEGVARAWRARLADLVAAAAANGHWTAVSPVLAVGAKRLPLEQLLELQPAPVGRDFSVQFVELGLKYDLLFVNAEVCSPWARLERPGRRLVGCGYAGACFGYLPTEEQVEQGGYEAHGFLRPFGWQGRWREGFSQRVRAAVDAAYAMGSSSTG